MIHPFKIASICLIITSLSFTGCGSPHSNHHEEEEEEAHHHDGSVVMEPEKAASFGVRVETLTPGEFSEVIKTSGRIEPVSSDRATVTARRSGIVSLPRDISKGAQVKGGSTIATISSRGVQGGDVNAAAKSTLDAAKKELDRLTPLYKEGLVTAAAYNEAERTYNEAKALASPSPASGASAEIAPYAGYITDIYVSMGQYVEVGAPIATVARDSRLTLRADVPGKYSNVIPTLSTANFRPDYSEEIFRLSDMGGKRISGSMPESSGGYIPVYFSFDSGVGIIPGAYAEVYLVGTPRQRVLSVPRSALLEIQGNKYVYVCEDGHAYEKRLVKTGASDGERVEILSGIAEGEQYVADGATIIRMAETSAVAPPGHTHNH